MFRFLKKSSYNPVAVFAVETGGITLTVVNVGADGVGEIVYAKARALESAESDAPSDALRKVAGKIEEIFLEIALLKRNHLIARARTLVLLGSPWNLSWREKITVKKDKLFRVTDDFVKETVKGAFAPTHKGLSIISSHVMNMRLNGYILPKPMGKQTEDAEFEVYAESAPDEALLAIGDAVSKHLPHGQIRFSTMMFASVEAVTRSMNEKDFILVLPEHDVTEISIVKGGSIQAGASMPMGSLSLARDIFGKKISPKEALSRTRRFIAGTLDAKGMAAALKPFDKIREKFLADFREVLWGMNESVLCPSKVFVGGRNIASFFMSEWIKKEDYAKEAFTKDCFKVSVVGGADIALAAKQSLGKEPLFASAVSVVAAEALARASQLSHATKIR